MAKGSKSRVSPSLEAIDQGLALLRSHPLFGRLLGLASIVPAGADPPLAKDAWVRITVSTCRSWYAGRWRNHAHRIVLNDKRRAEPDEWTNVIAQALLHIALNHCDPKRSDRFWRLASELAATDLLRGLGAGRRPSDLPWCDHPLPGRTVEGMATVLATEAEETRLLYGGLGLAGKGQPTWIFDGDPPAYDDAHRQETSDALAAAIRASILDAVDQAGHAARGPSSARKNPNSLAEKARSWFISSYPLLAALAAAFEIEEDEKLCQQYDIRIAAVDGEQRVVYVNPKFPWTYAGMQFTIAHELLHVGLSHFARRQGRDPYLWNIACDYVINGWLVEMGIGEPPVSGLMLDPELGLERESAEALYDRIVKDLRLSRRLGKVATLAGVGKPDMLGKERPGWWRGEGCDLDSFYRRALAEGIDLHLADRGRGLLPGDLIEEVRALQHPPVPWDVKLGQWLDAWFPPLERRRTFRRASRRQSATPDIPRPVYERPLDRFEARTFGVVIDTSGSMAKNVLARGLGAIASYAMSREVPAVRVVQCDAGVHDMGYVEPEALLETVEIKGRGGTVLKPAIDRLERTDDFPRDAPILVITDGLCDVFAIRREHAFLMPEGCRLPFRAAGPVFHFERPP